MFLLRRAFLQRQALLLGHQHDLQLGLASGQQQLDAHLQALQYQHQMQDFTIQLHEAFMQFMGGLYTGVSASSKSNVVLCACVAVCAFCGIMSYSL